jgi:hypothetical protein
MHSNAFTKLLDARETFKLGRNLDEKMLNRLEALTKGRLRQLTKTGYIQLAPIDIVRVIRDMPVDNKAELSLKNVVLNGVLNAENKSGGAGILALIFYYMLCQNEKLSELKQTVPRRCTSQEALQFIDNLIIDPSTNDILSDVLQIAGSRGRLTFETRKGKFLYHVANETGIGMPGLIENRFFDAALTSRGEITLSNVGLLVYDGTIENVSEIFSLCDLAVRDKKPLVIAAKAFSNDVITTLITNWEKNVARIIPVVLREDPHAIDDIIMAYELIPYGQHIGRPISSATLNDATIIQKIKLTPSMKVLLTQGNHKVITARLKDIRAQLMIAQAKRELALCDMLREREKDMSVNSHYVYLGDRFGEAVYATKDKLELGCRAFSETCHYGIIDLHRVLPHDTKQHKLISWLRKVRYVSARALEVAIVTADSIKRNRDSIARCVILDH